MQRKRKPVSKSSATAARQQRYRTKCLFAFASSTAFPRRRPPKRHGLLQVRLRGVALADFVPLLLGELRPGLRHFNQQGFIRLIGGFSGQANAFGRTPLVILDSGHREPSALAGNATAASLVPDESK
jgi:hypothetical protein